MSSTGRRAALVAFVAALVVATVLRTWNLESQALKGDEVHGLRAASLQDTAYLLSHNHLPGGGTDYSIPLALWNRLLILTVGLDEWRMRLPMLLAGILLVPLVAAFVWRRFGRLEGVAAAWLLATSPVLVFYSRFARPYGATALFAALALVGWMHWLRRPGPWSGAAVALGGAAGLFFSLTSVPSVACVWGLGLILVLRPNAWRAAEGEPDRRRERVRWGAVVLLGLLAASVLLFPSLAAQADFVELKAQRARPPLSAWTACGLILFGTEHVVSLVWLLGTTVLGAFSGFRRSPVLVAAALLMLVAQLAMIYALAPVGTDDPHVLARYTMAALPGLLVLLCLGLCTTARWLGTLVASPGWFAPGVVATLLGILVWSGPLSTRYLRANANTSDLFGYASTSWTVDRARIPSFYETLAAVDEDVTVAEWPWDEFLSHYQLVHGKRVQVVVRRTVIGGREGVELRATLALESVAEGHADFDYLVVHKDLSREWLHVTGLDGVPAAIDRRVQWKPSKAAKVLAQIEAAGRLREVHDDAWVRVFERRR